MTKMIHGIGLTGKLEGSYNGGGSLSASTDGILLDEIIKIAQKYANDGARPAPPGILGYQRRVVPSGREVTFPIKVSGKGSGAAYASNVVPSAVHVLLQAAGFNAAVTTTGGLEKWTYTPNAVTDTPSSAVLNVYERAQLYPITGAFCDLQISAKGPVVPTWEFATTGLMASAITDLTLPAITYPALSFDPPKAVNITFTLGNFVNGIVRDFTYKLGRGTPSKRLNINAGGHAGFWPGRQTPQLDVTFEATTLQGSPFTAASAIDPFQLFEAASGVACSLNVGSVQYNKWSLAAGSAQIMAPPVEAEDGDVSVWTLSLQFNPSSINANDHTTIIYN